MKKPADDLASDPLLRDAPTLEGFKVLEPAVLYARLGAGGMGAVYRGRHVNLECDVAVKVLKPGLAIDEQFVVRFEREAKIAARIKNDNIVEVKDVRSHRGIHYLVMEYVRGETARERVLRKGPLAEQEALRILQAMARGLRPAHTQGIVHRDIKPDNVLISATGEVKVADLGLAKQRSDLADPGLTGSGVMGTLKYMSPEQTRRSADVLPSSDVWALGATFYFLLTGEEAIPGEDVGDIYRQIRECEFPLLPNAIAVQPGVRALLAKCTRREASERYADAGALLKDLNPLVSAEEDTLVDPQAGAGKVRTSVVTPPPHDTLVRIKLKIAEKQGEPTESHDGPLAADGEPTVQSRKATAVSSPPPVAARRSAVWLLALLCLLALGGGSAYAFGWFDSLRGGAKSDPGGGKPPGDRPAPSVAPDKDTATRARDALQRAQDALPMRGKLDIAIAAFDEALGLDPGLVEAKRGLLQALSSKAASLEELDPDAAYDANARVCGLAPDDAPSLALSLRLTAVLLQRLRVGFALQTPTAKTVIGNLDVAVKAAITAPKARLVRFALAEPDPVAPGPRSAPFPRASALQCTIVDGAVSGSLRAPTEGLWLLRVEVEDSRGLVTELIPREVVCDTEAPVVVVSSPDANTVVGRDAAIAGTVKDVTKCSVRVADQDAPVNAAGGWLTTVRLGEGAQDVRIVATDSLGREGVAVARVQVDATPPVLTLASDYPKFVKQKQVEIAGTVRDTRKVTLKAGKDEVPVAADGSFVARVQLDEEREYSVPFVATDAAGNACAPVIARVRYDVTPPVLAWSEPKSSTVPAGVALITGTVTDASPCEVQVNSQSVREQDGKWSAVVPVAVAKSIEFKVTSVDAAGNEATVIRKTLRGEDPVVQLVWADAAKGAKIVDVDGKKYPSIVVEKQTGMRMVLIPAKPDGFLMGSPKEEAGHLDDEKQHRRVIKRAFYLGETEVTVAQWRRFVQATRYLTDAESGTPVGDNKQGGFVTKPDGGSEWHAQASWQMPFLLLAEYRRDDDHPVVMVSWNDAKKFCEQYGLVLPTEAQWEYACRAGSSTRFFWGDEEAGGVRFANVLDEPAKKRFSGSWTAFPFDDGNVLLAKVGGYAANRFGLKDMTGNVWEWCEDTYGDYPQDGSDERAATGGALRALRGGSWGHQPGPCRAAFRYRYELAFRNAFVGFRAAKTL